MSLTWTIDNDARQDLGPSGVMAQATASFGASDYATGGYQVFPSNFGLGTIRGMIPVGVSATGSGTPGGYEWVPVVPAVAGPAASNPWFLKAMATGAPPTETASNTNFNGGTLRVVAFGLP